MALRNEVECVFSVSCLVCPSISKSAEAVLWSKFVPPSAEVPFVKDSGICELVSNHQWFDIGHSSVAGVFMLWKLANAINQGFVLLWWWWLLGSTLGEASDSTPLALAWPAPPFIWWSLLPASSLTLLLLLGLEWFPDTDFLSLQGQPKSLKRGLLHLERKQFPFSQGPTLQEEARILDQKRGQEVRGGVGRAYPTGRPLKTRLRERVLYPDRQ